jgi:hypothetical protein
MRLLVLPFLVIFFFALNVAADPGSPSNITAQGGNVTFLDVNLSSGQTGYWQGFYGTVTGGIYLEDAVGSHFYDWNVVDAIGTVLATRDLISDWSNINCTNQTEIYEEEERLGFTNESSVGINDTFHNTTHPSFFVANREMRGCRSTLTNNQTDIQSVFWNVLLNVNSTTTVYSAILDNDRLGFNGTVSDFQLLVPVNTTTGQATYKIYVELA